ncbi:MAG: hypothetical protein IH957_09575 [Chloroflexi bacterium]|nr:hypothetical protein [Chloroflexota bacterium]
MSQSLDSFLSAVIQQRPVRLYFDTNVILSILRPKRSGDAKYATDLLDIAVGNGWDCICSYLGFMEALDIEQENMWFRNRTRAGEDVDRLMRRRHDRDPLSPQATGRIVNQLFERFVTEEKDLVTWTLPSEEEWEEAISLAINTPIRAPDCIHAASAITNECDVLVTSDRLLKDFDRNRIRGATPRELVAALKLIGH